MSSNTTVLVIGGGISGITAAIEASEAGADVLLVEKNPYLGGRVAQMNLYFPKLCPPNCGLEINLRVLRKSRRIRCFTQTEIAEVSGDAGKYKVTLRQNPRLINDKCTLCGACVLVCPEERLDEFNMGMGRTKAVYLPFPTAYPARYLIDAGACTGSSCSKCVETCDYEAIDLAMKPELIEAEVNAIVVATGWTPYDPTKLSELGYGESDDVITNMQLERLAASDGPTGGKIQRPSDSSQVQRVAFVQCAGSRDENHLRHCSGVCCMASLKEARYIREQIPDAEIYLFYIDIRSPGRLEDFYQASQKDEKLHLIKGKVARVASENGSLVVKAEDVASGRGVEQAVDLVVLATGIVPTLPELNGTLIGDEHGFLVLADEESGILPVGCVRRPADVAESARDATGAALKALQCSRG